MANKCLLMLILAAIVSGGVFAQTDFDEKPKNTIVVDIGPTIVGLSFSGMGGLLGGGEGLSSTGFGIGVQYERQILENLAVAGRFAYMGVGLSVGDSYEESGVKINTSLGVNLDTISIEAHVRYYPSGETFFLGGMLGYGNLSLTLSGDIAAEQEKISISKTLSRGFFKLGARIGWRINFGRQGGFTFEPSFGYDLAVGLGDTLGTLLQKEVEKNTDEEVNLSDMDDMFTLLEQFIFVGGPRLTLAFGWRF